MVFAVVRAVFETLVLVEIRVLSASHTVNQSRPESRLNRPGCDRPHCLQDR
jgi:hypothetical protein